MSADSANERLLQLLQSDGSGRLTPQALRAQGFEAPAQTVYALQLGGHAIDRVPVRQADGTVSLRYQLRGADFGPFEHDDHGYGRS